LRTNSGWCPSEQHRDSPAGKCTTGGEERLGGGGRTWKRILMTSRGEVTVREMPPEMAPASESTSALRICDGSSPESIGCGGGGEGRGEGEVDDGD